MSAIGQLLTHRAQLEPVLRDARTVAVLGAHPARQRPAFYVPDYLYGQGMRILPVNPRQLGQELWGEPVRASLTELTAADLPSGLDLLDVFRRSDAIADHVDEILAMAVRPRVVWLQLGIRHDPSAHRLVAAGIDVVQDRCTLADHRAWGLTV